MAPKKQRVLENLNPASTTATAPTTESTATPIEVDVAADDEGVSDREYLLSRQRASGVELVEPVAAAESGAWVQDELDPGEVCHSYRSAAARR